MLSHIGTIKRKSGPMAITQHHYNTGFVWDGTDMIQVRETFSTLGGRTLHSWQVMLERGVCWIGDFATARKALEFYTKSPRTIEKG